MSRVLNLPIVDISLQPHWIAQDSPERKAANNIVEALSTHGLVLVRPDESCAQANQKFLEKMVAFFLLPEPVKRRYICEQAGVKYEVGYMPPHAEHAQHDAEY